MGFAVLGLGLKAWGQGLRVWSFEFGFGVKGLEFVVCGLWFGVWGYGFCAVRINAVVVVWEQLGVINIVLSGWGLRLQDLRCRGLRVKGKGYRVQV